MPAGETKRPPMNGIDPQIRSKLLCRLQRRR